LKKLLREALARFGVLDAALQVRDYLRSIKFLKRNLQYLVRGAPDGIPIPPLPMIVLVTGLPDIGRFLETGRLAAVSISETLAKQRLNPESFDSMLDFGCGCGRITRWVQDLHTKVFFGVDYNQRLIDWCKKNLPFGTFVNNSLDPPLLFDDSTFDFIYAASVFTHFNEELQFSWMSELRRVLRLGGYLLFTTHGDYFLFQLSEAERESFLAGKLIVKNDGPVGSNWVGTYHPKEYVLGPFSMGYEMIDFIPHGAKGNPSQDIYLFKKQTYASSD
jgi:SAM-dependent methyltransferase